MEKLLYEPSALRFIACFLGSCGVLVSAWGLTHPDGYRNFLKNMPRNKTWARALLIINVIWSAPLTANFLRSMEFPEARIWIVYWIVAPAALLLIWFYVDHYLGARMLGWFLILLAKPILSACLVRDEASRYVLVLIAYYWIVVGMFIVAAPHFLRDWIALFLERPGLLKRSLQIKGVAGVALIAMGLLVY